MTVLRHGWSERATRLRRIRSLRLAMGSVLLAGGLAVPGCDREAASRGGEGSAGDVPVVRPERILSLVPSTTEMLFAIGGGDRLVGRTTHCNWPPEVASVPSVGSGLDPDMERVLRLAPDLVVASEMQRALPALERLRASGVEVLVLDDASLADIAPSFRRLGRSAGAVERAEALALRFDAVADRLEQAVPSEDAPSVFVVVGSAPVFAAGPESRLGEIVRLAGGANVLERGDWVMVDAEVLATLDPDLLIAQESLRDEPFRSALAPNPSRSFCVVDTDVLARPGPRMLEAIDVVERCVRAPRSPGDLPPQDSSPNGSPSHPSLPSPAPPALR